MQVRTFIGASTKAALEQIKAELGSDAVILGTRHFTEDGESRCEVTAALERSQRIPSSTSRPGAPTAQPDAAGPPGWDLWHREWSEIKDHILAFLKPQMDMGLLSPRQRLALEYLEREEVRAEVVLRLFRQLKADPGASVLMPLGRMITAREWGGKYWRQKYHGLIGPAGVGKTSCCIRLALHLKQTRPGVRILMVNADLSRSGGRMLLKHYAELSGLSYREAQSPTDLTQLSREAKDHDVVLIDLPSLPRDMSLEAFSGEFGLFVLQDLAIHLTLSPYFSPTQMVAFERQYFSPLVGSLIWTKLDEACTFGALINVAASTGLPISALSYGSAMRDSLVPAQSVMLWRLIFKHETPNGQDRSN